MLLNTRRRMLGLLAAAIGAPRLVQLSPPTFAAETETQPAPKKPECFALQAFGDWKGTATNTQAGARIGQLTFSDPDACDLRAEIQVAASYDAKLVVFGDPDGTPLPKDFLIKPDNRIIAKNEDGSTAVDEPLCGVCTDIRDDKVSIVLPLSTGALFRSAKSVAMAVKLGDAEECRFTLNCEDLRKALDWAVQRKGELAKSFDEKTCTPPAKGCFLTTACCEVLGLSDDCFELRTLRRYRDCVLIAMPAGRAALSAYYLVAPSIVERLPREERVARLLSVYMRFILPSAVAAWLGFNRLAYSLYARMMEELSRPYTPRERRQA
ncbi:CFI-box-CTERM domain-containing protein [Methyloceanibacter sp.]|uniref:CFI-box-CTERM domain-containing protein n=1 Tax=Methyloceanibacter sp. TaxID=1965321 RepID=UPI003D6C9090